MSVEIIEPKYASSSFGDLQTGSYFLYQDNFGDMQAYQKVEWSGEGNYALDCNTFKLILIKPDEVVEVLAVMDRLKLTRVLAK